MNPTIQLISGDYFDFTAPDPRQMTVTVIAHALANQCRFSGHVRRFYSVAEHCVRGSYACKDPLAFLLHDAAEAFIVDVPSPLKPLLPGYKELENQVHRLIEEKYEVSILDNPAVKHTDLVMLATEKQDLMPPGGGVTWSLLEGIDPLPGLELAHTSGRPDTWRRRYIERFQELTK